MAAQPPVIEPIRKFVENAAAINTTQHVSASSQTLLIVVGTDGQLFVPVCKTFRDGGSAKCGFGGAMDPGETNLEAVAMREAHEEMPGVDAMLSPFCWQYQKFGDRPYTTFTAIAIAKTPMSEAQRAEMTQSHLQQDRLGHELLGTPVEKLLTALADPKYEALGSDYLDACKKCIGEEKAQAVLAQYPGKTLTEIQTVILKDPAQGKGSEAFKVVTKALEAVRVKTEFLGRGFVPLEEFIRVAKESMALPKDAPRSDAQKAAVTNLQGDSEKVPLFVPALEGTLSLLKTGQAQEYIREKARIILKENGVQVAPQIDFGAIATRSVRAAVQFFESTNPAQVTGRAINPKEEAGPKPS
jgi:hypothetical protein